eukprot:13556980-Alexandrium_andersonii.AAC.1
MLPAGLGSAAGKLEHKVAAALHMMHMEASSLEDLQNFMSSCRSLTSDLGVEYRVSESIQAGIRKWFEGQAAPRSRLQDDA